MNMLDLQGKFDAFINQKFKISQEDAYGHKGLQIFVELGEALETPIHRDAQLEEFIDSLHFILGLVFSPFAKVDINKCSSKVDVYMNICRSSTHARDKGKSMIHFVVTASKFFNRNDFSKYWKQKKKWPETDCTDEWVDMFKSYIDLVLAYGFTVSEIEQKYRQKLAINYKRQSEGY